jgi:hypothetical protein
MDIGFGSVVTGSVGGTLTVTWSDVGFSGSGLVTMSTLTTLPSGGSVTYTSYVDGPNNLFGTTTQVGTYTSTGGNQALSGAASLLDNSFSMTEAQQIVLGPGQFLVSDDSLTAAPNPPLTLTCAVSSAQTGVPYSSSLTASGGVPAYTFAIIGTLPTGLTLNTSTGLISGTPSQAGNFSYTAQVTDAGGHVATTSSCGLSVLAGTPPPNISLACPALTSATQGQPYSSSLVASGGKPKYQFSGTGISCSSGLSVNASTGVISGTPTTSGTFTYVAEVTDSSKPSLSAYASCSLSISPPLGSQVVAHGDTATIGFWHNSNGQALILSLPGANSLGSWLASTFPNLYGATSSFNLSTASNATLANLFLTDFAVSGQKTKAQILAAALAVYVTDSNLGGTKAIAYGFNSSTTGTGSKTYNVGSNGKLIGLSNNVSYTVVQLLQAANSTYGSSTASDFNTIFGGINQSGDIN